MTLQEVSRNKCFGGHVVKYQHTSKELNCDMKFNAFLPQESQTGQVPVVYFLSGLTCTEDNFIQKSGAMAEAAKHGLALVAPDTSPRNVDIEGDSDSWILEKNYRMYSYVVKELFSIVEKELPIDSSKASIMGHSMGGHGALTIHLKNPSQFKTASAFSPIANPINCAWGQKAFTNYIGSNKDNWKQYDTLELLKAHLDQSLDILVDVGTADGFLENQLLIKEFEKNVKDLGKESEWKIRYQKGYDHSYFFISTFIADHIRHHAKVLK
ncbi:unnamed protein product [Rhizopus stolonifer]